MLLFVLACAPETADVRLAETTGADCDDGFERGEDGNCYPVEEGDADTDTDTDTDTDDTGTPVDQDEDGYGADVDCDDNDPGRHPDAGEICDGIDQDCDGTSDEEVLATFYRDLDGDGFGDANSTAEGCAASEGYVANGTDCDDGEAAAYPGANEVCDGIDKRLQRGHRRGRHDDRLRRRGRRRLRGRRERARGLRAVRGRGAGRHRLRRRRGDHEPGRGRRHRRRHRQRLRRGRRRGLGSVRDEHRVPGAQPHHDVLHEQRGPVRLRRGRLRLRVLGELPGLVAHEALPYLVDGSAQFYFTVRDPGSTGASSSCDATTSEGTLTVTVTFTG